VEEKRKKIDPRYRDPNYPDFVCRRSKPHTYKVSSKGKIRRFFTSYPERKTILIAGIAAFLVFFLCFFFCFFSLSQISSRDLHAIKKSLNPIFSFW